MKGLSVKDIRAIGEARYYRKLYKSLMFWLILGITLLLLFSSLVIMASNTENPQYTLPNGDVVEIDEGDLILVEKSVIVERDNQGSTWGWDFAPGIGGFLLFVSSVIYMSVQEGRARDKILEEWIGDGYQPKATDV